MEFHVVAQVKAPTRRLRRLPAFRERWNDFQILVAGDETLIDMRVMRGGGGLPQRVGVERFEVALVGVTQGLGRCRRYRQGGDQGERRCQQGLTYRHLFTFSAVDAACLSISPGYGTDPCCQSLAAAQARFPPKPCRFVRRFPMVSVALSTARPWI